MSDGQDEIMRTWLEVKASREGAVSPAAPQRATLQESNQQGIAWKRGLERFAKNNAQEVCDELTEMGIGTFARGILLAMEGPVCPMCHRGGEPWAYQTFAKVAKVIGDDTLQALALKTLGVSLEVIAASVKLYRSIEGSTPEETDRLAQEYLRARGWTCVAPAHNAEVVNGDHGVQVGGQTGGGSTQ